MKVVGVLFRIIVVTFLVAVLGGGGTLYYQSHTATKPTERLHTTVVTRGDLLSTISATGTLEPEEVVNVGAQVAGLIVAFGEDPRTPSGLIDYGSVVEKDTNLARLDPTPYEAALEQAEASLEHSEASLLQLEAKFRQAEREWKRAETLLPEDAIAGTDYDLAQSDYEAAKANLAAGKATIRQNKASVKTARVNLGYCTIKSPVRGTILDRRVNIGQTVVASLNAPSLFLIAKDLTKMQVWASVNEADIGRIRLDMPVRFTVDAHQDEAFCGKVTQIRLNAQMTQNVVTYTVIVTTDNSNGKLLPYLTANVQFEVDKRPDVLLVPNAALRWEPEVGQIDPAVDKTAISAASAGEQDHGRLWVVTDSGLVRPLAVTVGATDGTMTEISGREVKEGLHVVAGEGDGDEEEAQEKTADGDSTSNPFLPKPPKGSRPPPGPM
jgi:HlyD family secretion protein